MPDARCNLFRMPLYASPPRDHVKPTPPSCWTSDLLGFPADQATTGIVLTDDFTNADKAKSKARKFPVNALRAPLHSFASRHYQPLSSNKSKQFFMQKPSLWSWSSSFKASPWPIISTLLLRSYVLSRPTADSFQPRRSGYQGVGGSEQPLDLNSSYRLGRTTQPFPMVHGGLVWEPRLIKLPS